MTTSVGGAQIAPTRQEIEDDLAAVLDRVGDGVSVQDASGRLVYANEAAARALGYASAEEFVATPITEIMARFELLDERGDPFPRERLPGRRALAGEMEPAVTLRFRVRTTGAEHWSSIRASPILDADGRVRYVVNVWHDVTALKQAEESHRALAAIIRTSDDAIIGKTLDGVVTSWNPAAERLYGWTAAEMIGASIARIVPSERADELAAIFERLRRGARIEHYETVRVTRDGTRIDVSISIAPIVDDAGRITGAATIARDVTARKRAEATQRLLAEAGAILTASLDYETTLAAVARMAVPALADWCVVFLAGDDRRIRRVELAATEPAREELLREIQDRFPPDWDGPQPAARAIRTGEAILAEEATDEWLLTHTDDAEYRRLAAEIGLRAAMAVPLIARGRTLGALSFGAATKGRFGREELAVAKELASRAALAVDNARLYAEAHAAETRYRALFQGGALGVLLIGDDLRCLDANEAAAAMLGYTLEELLAIPMGKGAFLAGERAAETAADTFRRLRRDGSWSDEIELRRKDGILLPVEAHAVALDLPEGRAYVLQLLDATERRQRERLREELFAAISHDLKNPLSAIRGNAQLIRRRLRAGDPPTTPRFDTSLASIDSAALRMVTLIDDIIDAARLRTGQALPMEPAPTDLVELAARCVEQYQATTQRHRLRLETDLDELVAHLDPRRLERVVVNLVTNAIKYSPDGGEIVLRIEHETDEQGQWAVVSVSDRGIGVPVDDLPHLFTRFHRASNVGGIAGSGLGLAGVAQIVAQHGGEVLVTSDEGVGSTFTVRVPVTPQASG